MMVYSLYSSNMYNQSSIITNKNSSSSSSLKPIFNFDVDQTVAKYAKSSTSPIVVSLIKDNNAATYTYGDTNPTLAGTQLPTAQTLIPIGSVSKIFTTTLLADMVKRGDIDLNAPVKNYLPSDVKLPTFQGKEITVQDLATHTSGLPSTNMPNSTIDKLYKALGSITLSSTPGKDYKYSSIGTALLGEALGNAYAKDTGTKYTPEESYKTALQTLVLNPLGLTNTKTNLTDSEKSQLPSGNNNGTNINPSTNQPFVASGGIYSTADDLVKFIKANIDAEDKAKQGKPLTEIESAMVMAQNPIYSNITATAENGADQVGLSWYTKDDDVVLKTGSIPGFNSIIKFSKKNDTGVFISMGNTAMKPGALSDDLLKQLNGTKTITTKDKAGKVTGQTNYKPNGSIDYKYTTTYKADGGFINNYTHYNGKADKYTNVYDKNSNLISQTHYNPNGSIDYKW
jgi:CubicO group peptidase (beta-lactamase class C family)